ncbi:MAG TPA: carboxyl transferase domain-containing protein, partial [Actinomycetota bacterium]|nr:carboxyl transferase domain-containing protein [Actinomycetota bacterium]
GVVANQPQSMAGTIDVHASQKGAWFVGLCDRLRLPVVVLVDTPGFLPGRGQEVAGVIRHGAAFLQAFASATVPTVTVVLRKAYGGAYIVMNAKDLGADYAFAWPGAEIAVMGARGAVSILQRRKLAESPELRPELEDEYKRQQCTPWPAAHGGYVDEVIEPADTRARLLECLSEA